MSESCCRLSNSSSEDTVSNLPLRCRWKKFESIRFASPNQVKNMHNYFKLFLNPIHSGKITFLNFKEI